MNNVSNLPNAEAEAVESSKAQRPLKRGEILNLTSSSWVDNKMLIIFYIIDLIFEIMFLTISLSLHLRLRLLLNFYFQ